MGRGGKWLHDWAGEGKVGVKGVGEDSVGLETEDVGEGNDKLGGEGVKVQVSKAFAEIEYKWIGVYTLPCAAAHPL